MKQRYYAGMKTPMLIVVPVVAVFVAALGGSTDDDVKRYLAYCNATLGRSFDPFYVRNVDTWRRQFEMGQRWTPHESDPRPSAGALVPYRDFLVEYPPGFFLAALPPALLAKDAAAYKAWFEFWMLGWIGLSVVVCTRVARQCGVEDAGAPMAFWTLLSVVALGRVTVQRSDALVAALVCVMCWATLGRRPFIWGIAAGAALLTKIIPGLAAALCGLYVLRSGRGRDLMKASIATAGTVAAICAPFVLLGGPSSLWSVIEYHRDRPLEFESTAAALLGLWHAIDPSSATVTFTYGSTNVVGRFADLAITVSTLCCACAVAGVCWGAWYAFSSRREPSARARALPAAMVALLALVIVSWKVASLQFLWWVVPLGLTVCLVGSDSVGLVWLVSVLALAQVAFPLGWSSAESLRAWPYAALLARNLLLAAWAVRMFVRGCGLNPSHVESLHP